MAIGSACSVPSTGTFSSLYPSRCACGTRGLVSCIVQPHNPQLECVNGATDERVSYDPDLTINKQLLRVRNLRGSKRTVRLKKLMDPGHDLWSVKVSDQLRAGSRLEVILPALPFRNGQIHFNFRPEFADPGTSSVITGIEPMSNLL